MWRAWRGIGRAYRGTRSATPPRPAPAAPQPGPDTLPWRVLPVEGYARGMRRVVALAAVALLAACAPSVFDAPYPIAPVVLPQDDAAHAAPVEWWYWVAVLEADDGRAFGVQLTFFEAYAPPDARLWGVVPARLLAEKGLVAHAAITDLAAADHRMAQRFDGFYQGTASRADLDVSVGAWRAVRDEDGVSHTLTFAVEGYAVDLVLMPEKPAALHGDPPGIQTMGPGGVSYYVSRTRMAVRGSVRGPCPLARVCAPVAVAGQGWFDHQWGDFRIDRFEGWDWFALQFDDGADLMVYLIRDAGGTVVSAAGSYVTEAGGVVPLGPDDLAVVATGAAWTSPVTDARYPAGWRVIVPARDVDAFVVPRVADQEMDTRATTGIVYWEGVVDVGGARPGVGFVELTNYDRHPFEVGR